MRIVAFLLCIGSIAAVVGCKSPTSPTTPAQAPAEGSVFVFDQNGTVNGMPISWQRAYTIRKTADGFKAIDSSGDEEVYKLYDNGDIGWACSCDWMELGTASSGAYRTRYTSFPMKFNGAGFTAWARFESKYLGHEQVLAAGKSYDCSKIEVDGIVQQDDTTSSTYSESVNTYWYSPELRYFTRIDSKSYHLDSLVSASTMMLVSVK